MLLELFNFLHFVGLAWGVGGATTAAIISAKAEKNPEINSASMKIIPAISKLIFLGLILLVISGIGISFFVKWPLNKQNLIIKHILVALIVIIGVVIGTKAKKIQGIAPKGNEKPSPLFLKLKKQLKIFSKINLMLWYLVTLLSVFL